MRRALAIAVGLALAAPVRALPEEPTPFWLGPDGDAPLVAPPPDKKKAKKPKPPKPSKPKKKKAEPPPEEVRAEPPAQDVAPLKKLRRKVREKAADRAERSRADDEAEAVLRGVSRRSKRDDPAPLVAPVIERTPEAPAVAARPSRPARIELPPPPPREEPVARAERPVILPDPPPAEPVRAIEAPRPVEPPRPVEQPRVAPPPREPAPPATALTPPPPAEQPAAPGGLASSAGRPPIVMPGDREQAAAGDARTTADAQQTSGLASRRGRFNVTGALYAAVWGTGAAVGSRSWEPLLGLRISSELRSSWSFEAYGARSSSSTGNAYASTATSRLLFGGRAGRWLFERDMFAVQAAVGGAALLSSTKVGFRDVGGDPQAVDASGFRLLPEAAASFRFRPFRVLEIRADASLVYRDARLEPLLGLSLGAWVAF